MDWQPTGRDVHIPLAEACHLSCLHIFFCMFFKLFLFTIFVQRRPYFFLATMQFAIRQSDRIALDRTTLVGVVEVQKMLQCTTRVYDVLCRTTAGPWRHTFCERAVQSAQFFTGRSPTAHCWHTWCRVAVVTSHVSHVVK